MELTPDTIFVLGTVLYKSDLDGVEYYQGLISILSIILQIWLKLLITRVVPGYLLGFVIVSHAATAALSLFDRSDMRHG